MENIIVAENLSKYYGGFQALKGISFSVKSGECFGFLGHNGAGKSTTMRMIYGLSTVEEGHLSIFGQNVHLTPPAIKKVIGIVPQEDNLDPDLTCLENLQVYGSFFGLSRSEATDRAIKLMELMGLEEKKLANIESLSGGLKRRLVIARALINNPKLVILDEPTTGLDPQARHLVWQKLRNLKTEGVTFILTTHYMEEAMQLCDRLVIMHEGRILTAGTPYELIKSHIPPYAVEIRIPVDAIPQKIFNQAHQFGVEILQVIDGVFLYGQNGDELCQNLYSCGLPNNSCFLRPSGLEDVFLKLTGKGEDN